ncbi:uncharacterized protein H6S33_001251 [Morchella sextelata]|uniref:uncharacterized protein n=1 Tax=Morchella sextelata TaxID=1174677 RepID=UPI001D04C644|nr:uncharacterized protein H6S33_001251 [Morchella sextelata]KAH0609023.1 hypothetical protein H6S33_001251 [Morchella sextelata]
MSEHAPIDYQQLSNNLRTFFQTHPQVDEVVGTEAYALLQQCQNGLAQYATDLQEIEAEAERARRMFERDIAAARAQQTAVQVVVPEGAPVEDNVPPAPPVPPATDTTYRSEKLPDPEVFRGDRDRERLHLFKQQMKIKLLGNADRYPTLQSKLSYAFSRLEGIAANQFLQYVGEGGITLPSMIRFYKVLDTAFGDPDRMRTARRNLRNIRQRNRTFADYFAEFQRYAAESGMDEASRIEALMEGINGELDESMIHHDTPATVDACATLLQRLDNRRRAAEAKRGSKKPWNVTTTPTPRPPPANPVSAPRAAAPVANAPVTESHPSSRPGGDVPMDLSGGRRRPSPAERNARLVEGRCFYCGGVGHMVRDCPQARATGNQPRRPVMRRAVLTVEENDGSDNESAKDLSLH